jgi:integrase
MASAWIRTRETPKGQRRFRVEFRLGGRESRIRYGGSFKTMREAKLRRDYIAGELVSQRVPDLRLLVEEPPKVVTVSEAASRWLAARIDVGETTTARNRVELKRILPHLGARPVAALDPAEVAAFVVALHEEGYKRATIRKTLQTLAMVLDHAAIDPNPARDRQVRLPREEREEVNPPSADHIEAVYRLLPERHRLALLFLDWSGARVAAIDLTLVGDYDEPRRRVRLRTATTKTRRALWIDLPPELAEAIEATLPHRKFRDPRRGCSWIQGPTRSGPR